jgi:ribonuclease VapC
LIVADTSALIAILRLEPEADAFLDVLAGAESCLLSAVSLQEASVVLASNLGTAADWRDLDLYVERFRIEIVPHDAALARLARDAFLRFGKGRHPAGLNFGDCASYALAKQHGVPLLYKGGDFTRTDLTSALRPGTP